MAVGNTLYKKLRDKPDLFWGARLRLMDYHYTYVTLLKLAGLKNIRPVTGDTDIVIEGFPRSASTFATRAFILGQATAEDKDKGLKPAQIRDKYNLKIANHLHIPTQFTKAIKLGVPRILCIRSPLYAITSAIATKIELGYNDKVTYESVESYLQYYLEYHKRLLPYKEMIVIADFETITTDFGWVIEKVNNYFNTDFGLFEHTPQNMDIIKGTGKHLLPSKERDKIKKRYIRQMAEHHDLLLDAIDLHKKFLEAKGK